MEKGLLLSSHVNSSEPQSVLQGLSAPSDHGIVLLAPQTERPEGKNHLQDFDSSRDSLLEKYIYLFIIQYTNKEISEQ